MKPLRSNVVLKSLNSKNSDETLPPLSLQSECGQKGSGCDTINTLLEFKFKEGSSCKKLHRWIRSVVFKPGCTIESPS